MIDRTNGHLMSQHREETEIYRAEGYESQTLRQNKWQFAVASDSLSGWQRLCLSGTILFRLYVFLLSASQSRTSLFNAEGKRDNVGRENKDRRKWNIVKSLNRYSMSMYVLLNIYMAILSYLKINPYDAHMEADTILPSFKMTSVPLWLLYSSWYIINVYSIEI